jgi:xanthine dehydrogenase YagS FAD-binding subunit
MAMNRFAYAAASTVDEACEVLNEDCRPLAGGVDLLDRMKEGLVAPARLVSLRRIPGLDRTHEDSAGLHIGALTPLYRLLADPLIADRPELACLHQALAETAIPQVRHMATIGGNLLQRPRCWYFRNKWTHCLRKGGERCFAFRGENKRHAILGGGPCYIVHPSDPAVALLALDASVIVTSAEGTRTVPLHEFYLLPRQDPHHEVALAMDEMVTEVIVPTPTVADPSTGAGAGTWYGVYLKVPERGSRDFALASVALQLNVEAGVVRRARVSLGGVAPVPWRARAVEQALAGRSLTVDVIDQVSEMATEDARPLEQNAYKVDLVRGLLKQTLQSASESSVYTYS